MRGRREWHLFQVALTGAFLTGVPVQVRLGEYHRFQRELGEKLTGHASGGWDYEGIQWRDVPSYKYGGGGYTSLAPLVLVQRNGEKLRSRTEITERSEDPLERQWLESAMRGWSWALREVRVQVYDFGVGVVVGSYDVQTPISVDPATVRRTVRALCRLRPDPSSGVQSPIAASYKALAHETVRVFRGAVATCEGASPQEPWLAPALKALPPADSVASANGDGDAFNDEWGRLLWLHPVYVLAGPSSASSIHLNRLARPFRATYSQAIDFTFGVFVPGVDWSVIAARGDFDGQEVPMRLTELHWAYYALFMEMDRGLLATLQHDKWHTPGSLSALEGDAARMFQIFMRVREARARLDSALAEIGGGQLSLWSAIANVTKFDELVGGVEAKVEVLQRVADRRVQEAAVVRSRRTERILSSLTALTVVTLIIALVGNIIGSRADKLGHIELRVLTMLAAFLLAAILYREALREIERRRLRDMRLASRLRRPSAP
jgi:hypothetical protein